MHRFPMLLGWCFFFLLSLSLFFPSLLFGSLRRRGEEALGDCRWRARRGTGRGWGRGHGWTDRQTENLRRRRSRSVGGRGRASGDGGSERCRGGGETGKGKASKLDREPAGQTEGNESLDGPRRAVRGTGVPGGRGGRVSAKARSCQSGGAWVRRVGAKPRQAGGLMDGLARWW